MMEKMTVEEMQECIEGTDATNIWLLIESEPDAVERFNMRDVFFQAIKQLNICFDMPTDTWKE